MEEKNNKDPLLKSNSGKTIAIVFRVSSIFEKLQSSIFCEKINFIKNLLKIVNFESLYWQNFEGFEPPKKSQIFCYFVPKLRIKN